MNKAEGTRIRKFNPGTFQSDSEVIDQFVVRHHELDTVLDILDGNVESSSCQHVLVVAPRGRGKTMLLARVAAQLRVIDELSEKLLPVRFMEESMEIFNLADFWLEALFYLAKECARSDSELARELRDSHAALSMRWRNGALENYARATVLDAADRLDRKLVLMVENLHALCKDVDEDFGWKLRQVLQTESQIMLVGSATSRFEGLADAKEPFFELFRIIDLKPLNTNECQRLWEDVSGESVSGRVMRPLEILTGGSPRLLVIVAGIAQHKSMRRLMEELVLLVDEHTEYFRGHLEAFGKTERRVYLAVIDLWQLSTPSEIRDRARMDIRKVSTMLGRLVNRGAVVVEGDGRKRRYAAAERLYSIYYKLRRERDEVAVVENLIRFMAVFYGEAERKEMFSTLMLEAAESSVIQDAIARVIVELPELSQVLTVSKEQNRVARALRDKGEALHKRGDLESAISVYEEIVELFGNVKQLELQLQVAVALIFKAIVLRKLGKLDSAISACEEVVELFGNIETSVVREVVGITLVAKGVMLKESGDFKAAMLANEEAKRRLCDALHPAAQLATAAVITEKGELLWKQGDPHSAVSALEEVVTRFGSSGDPHMRRVVVRALINKGHVLQEQGDYRSAVSAWDEVVTRFDTSDNPELQKWIAWALVSKTEVEIEMDRTDDALATYDQLKRRIDLLSAKSNMQMTSHTMRVRSWLRLAQGDLQAAIDSFRLFYGLFKPTDEAMMRRGLKLVIELVATGAGAHDMLKILSSNDAGKASLNPLIVALRQEAGETVRAPDEILEVAGDIQQRIRKRRMSLNGR